jgi:hypothetical protein
MFPIAVLPVEPQKEQNEHQAQQTGENPMREHVKDIRHFKVDLYRRVSMPTTIGAARVGVRFRLRAAIDARPRSSELLKRLCIRRGGRTR